MTASYGSALFVDTDLAHHPAWLLVAEKSSVWLNRVRGLPGTNPSEEEMTLNGTLTVKEGAY
jgi:hypothetical protein